MDNEFAIKQLQEEVMWLNKDLCKLKELIENFKPIEVHLHYNNDFRTCKECDLFNQSEE